MNPPIGKACLEASEANPPPEGITAGVIAAPDGVPLRYAVCASRHGKPRGTVVLLQGRNEAIEKYFETIADLTALGYCVAAFDWRGQGGSGRLLRDASKGHVPSFQCYVADLECVLGQIVLVQCPPPYAILAHSMGGAVALLASQKLQGRIEAIVASAPLVALPPGGPGMATLYVLASALRLAGLGALPLRRTGRDAVATLEDNPLTADPLRFSRNLKLADAAPHLFLGAPTAAWLAAATAAMRRFDEAAWIAASQVPTLIVTAGADSVVSSPAAERLAGRLPSGQHLGLPGARHEILQELDRHRGPFLAAFEAFVGAALPPV